MIFYQLRGNCDQKHPYPPPIYCSQNINWRFYTKLFYKSFVIFFILTAVTTTTSKAQSITIKAERATLRSIMNKIEQQSGYDFWYNKGTINESEKISIDVKNQTLQTLLSNLFGPRRLSFELVDKTIFLKPAISKTQENPPKSKTEIQGIVVDTEGKPIPNATIKIKATNFATIADESGAFKISSLTDDGVLLVSSLGFSPIETPFSLSNRSLKIVLSFGENKLEDVQVVSTGYQNIPKERATGAFTQIDNKLINRSVSTNLLDRLDGVTNSLIFTKNNIVGASQSKIEVRGRTTLFSNAEPLIVIDNFPYDGDLANINPNDIENITILKDGAAASIWGSRSGNGVIVITTKKGKLNAKPKVSFVSNITLGEKPDLYYTPQLSSEEYIDVEKFLFNKGTYNTAINNGYSALSPAVEIFNAKKKGDISAADSLKAINLLKGYDLRSQQLKYLYRTNSSQQYLTSISGGSDSQIYYVSAGYDKNLLNLRGNNYQRITLNANNTYFLIKNKLEINSGIVYTNSSARTVAGADALSYPYSQFADVEGNALEVARTLRPSYASTVGNGKLLNWLYKPLEEFNNGYSGTNTNLSDYRVNLSLKYNIIPGLQAAVYYNYENSLNKSERLNELESFYTRNLINQYTQINPTTGTVSYPLPIGAILSTGSSSLDAHNGRFLLNYDQQWNVHKLAIIAGTEIRASKVLSESNTFYGYNPDTRTNQNLAVNTTVNFPLYYGNSSGRIIISPTQLETDNRYLSYFLNGSYGFRDKYLVSWSVRKDESNIFGVSTNQKGVPLWSAGLAWIINKEDFFHADWVSQLKLRATFGYTGNVNNNISAYLTATSTSGGTYNTYYATIQNPPNPSLRWEKYRNFNIGLDFGIINNRIQGSFDLWTKSGLDLIGSSAIAPQTGINLYTGNTANTKNKGIDLEINSTNLNGDLKWQTNLIINYAKSEVSTYMANNGNNYNVVSANYANPLVGYPYYALFSFKYAGVNNTGDPVGYVNGQPSIDYTAIRSSTNRDDLVYSGSAVPTYFGSVRNTFTYKDFDLSFNISFKLGYYFRKRSLENDALYGGGSNYQMADYQQRWQKPGDELITNVPALIYPSSVARSIIYTYSDVLIQRADHFRLRDIRLGYSISKSQHSILRNANLFLLINNLGLLWKANKVNIDPDFVSGIPTARTLAVGFRTNL